MIIQCNGSGYYRPFNSPARVLAKYVRGFDIVRAMSVEGETIFGNPEWDHLSEGVCVSVCHLKYVFDIQPLDSLLHHYGKITNIIARSENINYFSADHINALFSELIACRRNVEEWKSNLPPYYKATPVPITHSNRIENSEMLQNYPYEERLEYTTG
jgi:hypothetical protein